MRPMSVFQDGFFGDLFEDCFRDFVPAPVKQRTAEASPRFLGTLKTDIKDMGDSFILEMDIPGYKKEDVSAELKDGNLIIKACKEVEKEDKPEDGRYIRRERFTGCARRSFYVGKKLTEADIKASFADGVLTITVPKENTIEREEEKKLIPIL